MSALKETVMEAFAMIDYYKRQSIKGSAIFKLPLGYVDGEMYVDGRGLPLYLIVSKYGRDNERSIAGLFTLSDDGKAILGSKFSIGKGVDISDELKSSILYLKDLTKGMKGELSDKGVYEELKTFKRESLATITKDIDQLKWKSVYTADSEDLEKGYEMIKKNENLEVFFMNVGTAKKIDDSNLKGKFNYLYVAVDRAGGYFRAKLNEGGNEDLYSLLLQAKEPKTGLLHNRLGSFILADTSVKGLIKQVNEYADYTPAMLEAMRPELEKQAQENKSKLAKTLEMKISPVMR